MLSALIGLGDIFGGSGREVADGGNRLAVFRVERLVLDCLRFRIYDFGGGRRLLFCFGVGQV
jgi:hypothetical protein